VALSCIISEIKRDIGRKSRFLSLFSILTSDIDIAILSVCLSVCPSVRYVPVSYRNGLTYCHGFFTTRQHNHSTLMSIEYQTASRNSDGVTPCGGAKYRWGIKFCDFRQISGYISQTIQDSVIVTMEGEYETVRSFRMVPVSMTLSDP